MTPPYTALDGRVKPDADDRSGLRNGPAPTNVLTWVYGDRCRAGSGASVHLSRRLGNAVKPLLVATATEAPDEQLVAAVREGSDEAFEALFRRYRAADRRLRARAWSPTTARAEDIIQEAFMSALRALRRSRPGDRLPALDLRDRQERVHRPSAPGAPRQRGLDRFRRLRPPGGGAPSQSVAATDAEVARRKELESLRMAFGDLPELAAPDPRDARAGGALLRQDRQHAWAFRGARSRACSSAPGAACVTASTRSTRASAA